MYRLIVSPRASKQLKKIKQGHQMAMNLAILDIKENPEIGKSLIREYIGKFSYRVGVYRIISKVNEKDKIVNIISAGHRAIVYS